MTKNLICIACPRGCHLTVSGENLSLKKLDKDSISISGNRCPKGIIYGQQEIIRPMRTLTTTVAYTPVQKNTHLKSAHTTAITRLPVKTQNQVPLSEITEIMKQIRHIQIKNSVKYGDTVATITISDNTIIPIIATATTEQGCAR